MSTTAVAAAGVGFAYGDRTALRDVSFEVRRGTVHGFLGPNGSGKSTLFKLLSTLVRPQTGRIAVFGLDLAQQAAAIRKRLGVVFQSPAVDRKLTVRENLRYGGLLLGLGGRELSARIDELLVQAGLADRARDRVEQLSGGLRRRVELAKCLLGRPDLVLLDEASTGLDPAARRDMWAVLRARPDLTVLFTTHLMDEAADADEIALLDEGRIVAAGRPADLMRSVGGQVLEVETADAEALARDLEQAFAIRGEVVDGALRIAGERVHEFVPGIMARCGDRVQRLQLAHPSLRDVFLARTGRRFVAAEPAAEPNRRRRS